MFHWVMNDAWWWFKCGRNVRCIKGKDGCRFRTKQYTVCRHQETAHPMNHQFFHGLLEKNLWFLICLVLFVPSHEVVAGNLVPALL